MSIFPHSTHSLFPGRNLAEEWISARISKDIPPLVRLKMSIDLGALKELVRASMKNQNSFYPDHVAEAFVKTTMNNRPTEYCFGLVSRLSERARVIQNELDQTRGCSWQIHQESLNKRQILRSLYELDENYDPIIDERNYNVLPEWAKGTEIERITKCFTARCVRIRFAKLEPGEMVSKHIDTSARYGLRVLIPIFSNCLAEYFAQVQGHTYSWPLLEGAVYIVNGGYPHWAVNNGVSPRIVLIISLDGQADLSWIEKAVADDL